MTPLYQKCRRAKPQENIVLLEEHARPVRAIATALQKRHIYFWGPAGNSGEVGAVAFGMDDGEVRVGAQRIFTVMV